MSTLISSELTSSAPAYMVCQYEDPTGVPADSTSTTLIELPLPAPRLGSNSLLHVPYTDLTGRATSIMLIKVSVSCLSTNFNISFLNINDMTKLNTINEVLKYTDENLNLADDNFNNYIILNRDLPDPIDRLYVWIYNKDTVNATGPISFELIYIPVTQRK